MKFKSLLMLMVLGLLVPFVTSASINTEDNPPGLVAMDELVVDKLLSAQEIKLLKKEEKKQVRMEKRMERLEKFMHSKLGQKLLGGLDDPVDKWFWYWIIGWGAGLVLVILATATLGTGFGVLGILATLAWLFGSVSLIIWLVKKFS